MDDSELATLGAVDYVVFVVMLLISLAIGIYYAVKDRSSKEGVQGYLLAARQMNCVPVAISLSLSFVSAVTVLGVPAEIYIFGPIYMWTMGATVWITPVVTEVYLSTFYRLKITSAFEYIEKRFDTATRLISTFIYIIQNVMYIGIMIYAPALALSSVTSFNIWLAITSIGIVCTLYTTFGGLKAVIWTDVFQGTVLFIVMIVTLAMSVTEVGGFDEVWAAARRGDRLDFFHFETDPRIRNTFWSTVIGLGFLWLSVFGTNQSQVQRYLCCTTEMEAKKGVVFGIGLSLIFFFVSTLTGFVIYAYFEGCDPLISRKITAADQILPYMIMRIFRNLPGMPGLFIAGLFAGCLSTVSSGINAMACVTVKDFIQPYVKWSSRKMAIVSKGMVFLFGSLCIGFACLSSVLGGVLQASLSVLGMVGGPLLGVFTVGMLFPFSNSNGAKAGLVAGIAFAAWVYIGSTVYPPGPEFTNPKPRFTNSCIVATPNVTEYFTTTVITTDSYDTTLPVSAASSSPPIADLYHISYAYLAALGFTATMLVGIIVSLATCGHRTRKDVDPKLIVFLFDHKLFCWLPYKFRRWMRCGLEKDVHYEDEDVEVTGKYIPKEPMDGHPIEIFTINGDNGKTKPEPDMGNDQHKRSPSRSSSVSKKSSASVKDGKATTVEESGHVNQAYEEISDRV